MPDSEDCCLGYINPIIEEVCENFEEIRLPKAHWTKTRMLEAVRIGGLSEDALARMAVMRLDDLKKIFLIPRGNVITRSPRDTERQRHTVLYALDWTFINHYYGVDCQ